MKTIQVILDKKLLASPEAEVWESEAAWPDIYREAMSGCLRCPDRTEAREAAAYSASPVFFRGIGAK